MQRTAFHLCLLLLALVSVPATASSAYQPSQEELCRFKSQAADIMMQQRLSGASKEDMLGDINPDASDEEQQRIRQLIDEIYDYDLTGENDAQKFVELTKKRCLTS